MISVFFFLHCTGEAVHSGRNFGDCSMAVLLVGVKKMSGFHHVLELMVLCITKAPLGRFNEEVGCQKLCGTSIHLCAGLWP